MAQLDRIKETVAYEKFWLGIAVVSDISLLGWLMTVVDAAPRLTFFLAALGAVLLSLGVIVLHRRIERRIEEIGTL